MAGLSVDSVGVFGRIQRYETALEHVLPLSPNSRFCVSELLEPSLNPLRSSHIDVSYLARIEFHDEVVDPLSRVGLVYRPGDAEPAGGRLVIDVDAGEVRDGPVAVKQIDDLVVLDVRLTQR